MNDIIIINGKEFKKYDDNYYVSKDAEIYDVKRNRFLNKYMSISRCKSNKKYECVSMYNKSIKVYKIVYSTWCGSVPPGYQINHIDDNGENSNLDNLYLGTKKDNTIDAFRNSVMYETVKTVVVFDKYIGTKLTFLSTKAFAYYIGLNRRESINKIKQMKSVKDRFIFYDSESVETKINYNDLLHYNTLYHPIIFEDDCMYDYYN